MRRALAVVGVALTIAALGLTGCGSDPEQGPAGRVVAKDKDRDCHSTGTGRKRHRTCDTEYELTTRDKDGDQHEFEVGKSDYDACYRGSHWPTCKER